MVGTIGLAGSKARIRGDIGTWWRGAGGLYVGASLLGGLLLGAVGSFIGLLLQAWSWAPAMLLVALLLILGLADLTGLSAKRYSHARQVPLSWKHKFPPVVSAPLYGLTLGSGVFTSVYYWNFFALLLLILVTGEVALGLLGGIGFGVGRAAPVVLAALSMKEVGPRQSPDTTFDWVNAHKHFVRFLAASASLACAAIAYIRLHG